MTATSRPGRKPGPTTNDGRPAPWAIVSGFHSAEKMGPRLWRAGSPEEVISVMGSWIKNECTPPALSVYKRGARGWVLVA